MRKKVIFLLLSLTVMLSASACGNKEIKSKFEVTKLSASVSLNDKYKLPNKIKAKINNEDKEVNVVWNKNTVDTSKVGNIKYQGKIEQYDRTAELNLKVIKAEKAKKIGGISKVYEDNGKRYLSFDEGNVNGRLTDGYYIRNKDKRLKTYEISPNAHISVCGFSVNLDTVNQQKISYEKFKTVDMGDRPRYRGVLCHIYLENNVVVKIEQQYIP